MTDPAVHVLTLLAALGSALVGGVLLAFSDFVMKSLGRIAPEAGVAAMQEINVVVLRSWFLRVFFATALLAVTVFKNVPLNNKLARDRRAAWAEYLVAWTRWNHLRTVAALAAAALFMLAL